MLRRALATVTGVVLVMTLAASVDARATPANHRDAATTSATTPSTDDRTFTPVPSPGATVISGGDVVTLRSPVTIRSAALGRTWVSIRPSAAHLPTDGVAALVLAVSTSRAARSGQLLARATGNTGAGSVATGFSAGGDTGVAVVRTGAGGTVQVRATTSVAKVSLRVVAWVPETASLVVPDVPPAPVTTRTGTTTRSVRVAGTHGVPADATSVLVAIGTSASRAGSLLAWRAGTARPSAGLAYPSGGASTFALLSPSATGWVSVRSTTTASTTVRVVAWSSGTTTVTSLRTPTRLATVRPGAARTVRVAGAGGVPSTARAVVLALDVARGAVVRVWSTTSTRTAPVVTAGSHGVAVPLVLAVPSGGTLSLAVTGTAPASVLATGYSDALGGQKVSFVARPGTHLIGPGDVASQSDALGTVDLVASAGPVASGDHLLVRPRVGAPYAAQVTGIEPRAGGVRRLTVAPAQLADAFVDYTAQFHGAVSSSTSAAGPAAARSFSGVTSGVSLGLPFFDPAGGLWSCDAGIDPKEVLRLKVAYSGRTNLDVSLRQRSIDFSMRGSISVTLTLLGGATVSCEVSGDVLDVPLGATGLALKLGGTASLGITLPDNDHGGTASVTGGLNVYASFWSFDGASGGTRTAHKYGSASVAHDGLQATLDLGVYVGVGLIEPPGTHSPVEASASITMGMTFQIGAPDPSTDLHARTMRGPRCLDLTVGPFVEVGADVAIPFFPDVSVSIARWEGPKEMLYSGPCWGYSGTITFTFKGASDNPDGSVYGCTAEFCVQNKTWDLTMVKTLVPQAASFTRYIDASSGEYGAPIVQPYSWTYRKHDTETWQTDPCWASTGCGAVTCHSDLSDQGKGSVFWSVADPTKATIFDGYDTTDASVFSGAPDGAVTDTTVISGDDYCGPGTTTQQSGTDSYLASGEVGLPLPMNRASISVTLGGNVDGHPDWSWKAVVALTRHEYAR